MAENGVRMKASKGVGKGGTWNRNMNEDEKTKVTVNTLNAFKIESKIP